MVTSRIARIGPLHILMFAVTIWPISKPVCGQVELIVRADTTSALGSDLERQSKREIQVGQDSPFRSALSVAPLFSHRRSAKSSWLHETYVITVADSSSLTAVLGALDGRTDVVYAQANHTYELDVGLPDPFADSLSHTQTIDLQRAWSITAGSSSVVVGFVDTGVFFEHPDLIGQFAVNDAEDLDGDGLFTSADANGLDDDGNGYVDDVTGYDFVDRPFTVEAGDFHVADPDASDDGSGHGTNVAGIIGAARDNGIGIVGVAPGVRLLPIRAFGRDGRGEDDDIARAIVYGVDAGVRVLNLSFGDSYISPLMQDAIRYAVDTGVTVVASAGNSGGDRPHYPSDYPGVISVVWLTSDGSSISSRATHGTGIDLGAPGSSVFTTLLTDDQQATAEMLYGRRSGSSMAAPMVSAAAALLRSVRPDLAPHAVRSILTSTARDIEQIGWDHRSGAGLLQVGAAVRAALPARVEITSPGTDASLAGDLVEVSGSAIDPSFVSYDVSFAPGAGDVAPTEWVTISGPLQNRVLNGLLAHWEISSLAEGVFTLRLRVNVASGRAIEDRRRVIIDRSPPAITIRLLDDGLVRGRHAVIADVETDDLTDVTMSVDTGGQTVWLESDRTATRHGLSVPDNTLAGGTAAVTVVARNRSGLQAMVTRSVTVPPNEVNTALFTTTPTSLPHGFLLEVLEDFDSDALPEIVLNVYEDGWIGDTLAIYEWGGGFRRAASLLVGAFPRSTGDTDNDGRRELLTQVGAATIVLEQEPNGYPSSIAFIDSTGLDDSGESFWGAHIFDLDDDGTDEIIGHNTTNWRLIEWDGVEYSEVARLSNETGVAGSEIGQNSFEQPQLVIGDLDADGRRDFLTGDSDGDWIVYESTGNDTYEHTWSYESPLYNAAARMTSGDFDGDGSDEFVTFAHNWLTTTAAGVREPDLGTYFIFDSDDNDSFVVRDSIAVSGEISQHGTVAAADFDADGADELIVVNPPDLYVIRFDDVFRWSLMYHTSLDEPDGAAGIRSIKVAAGDIDLDGLDEVIFSAADGQLYILEMSQPPPSGTTPAWVSAISGGQSSVQLVWHASGTDSTRVYRGDAGTALALLTTTVSNSLLDSVSVSSDYALRGWRSGVLGGMSRVVNVTPHASAALVEVRYPSPDRVEVEFTRRLQPELKISSFSLASGQAPSSLVQTRGMRAVNLEFVNVAPGPDTLRWSDIFDAEGAPVAHGSVPITFEDADDQGLFVLRWKSPARDVVLLTFSDNLDPAWAQDRLNYSVRPFGRVAAAAWDASEPASVALTLDGVAVGATGLETILEVIDMRSSSGARLALEGSSIRLSSPADDLASVYVFPNPVDASVHSDGLMIAGLPKDARVKIFSSAGVPVRELHEADGLGGTRWTLTDESGNRVPSGIYLIRVSAPGIGAILKKAAIID